MLIQIITLFPEEVTQFLNHSMIWKAQKEGIVEIQAWDLRFFGLGSRRTVDDRPYGGGAGMVLRPEPLVSAIETAQQQAQERKLHPHVILLTPQGTPYQQSMARSLAHDAGKQSIILVCGHYEGFDERVRSYVDQEISVGDFILTGGELPALILIDSIVRLLPGVLGAEAGLDEESHNDGQLEYAQYTRPEVFRGQVVPEILRSGHHAQIQSWRERNAQERTQQRRPDLLQDVVS